MGLFLQFLIFTSLFCAPLAKAGKDEHGSNDGSICDLALTREVAQSEIQKLMGPTSVKMKLESAETLLRLTGQGYLLPNRSLRELFSLSKRHLLFKYGPFWQQRVQFTVNRGGSDKEIEWVAYDPAQSGTESLYHSSTQCYYSILPNLSRASTVWLSESDLLRVLEWGVVYRDELPASPLVISVAEKILCYE